MVKEPTRTFWRHALEEQGGKYRVMPSGGIDAAKVDCTRKIVTTNFKDNLSESSASPHHGFIIRKLSVQFRLGSRGLVRRELGSIPSDCTLVRQRL